MTTTRQDERRGKEVQPFSYPVFRLRILSAAASSLIGSGEFLLSSEFGTSGVQLKPGPDLKDPGIPAGVADQLSPDAHCHVRARLSAGSCREQQPGQPTQIAAQ